MFPGKKQNKTSQKHITGSQDHNTIIVSSLKKICNSYYHQMNPFCIKILQFITLISSCSCVHAFSNPSSKVKATILPQSELINRRKSPALWREDLKPLTSDDNLRSNVLPKRPPEVMAPCGGFPQLKAAIANGADSVYLGLSAFSARARASNFDPQQLKEAVQIAHASGVKVYVALNTLVFQEELEEVAGWISVCDRTGVDAIIVQDIGVTRLAREIAPNLEIHASTQQTVTNTDGVIFAKERGGANRVVLGRELSINEIKSVTNDLNSYKDLTGNDIEIEAFVHGALCVSYSGQCFSSEAWGGRSANRGQCAQACRLPYGLIRNGDLIDLQDMNYLLSPQDLCGIDHVEELVRAGVSCLKIEGRLKDEKYVAATTRAYRNAVDTAWAKIVEEHKQRGTFNENIVQKTRFLQSFESVSTDELAQLFARGQDEQFNGLTPGFFDGSQHQQLVRGRSPRHRGVHIGRVAQGTSAKNGVIISLDESNRVKPLSEVIKLGDGVVIDRGMPQEIELGGPIFKVGSFSEDGDVVIRFGRDVERNWKKTDESSKRGIGTRELLAPIGAHVWKTADATVDKKMKRLIESSKPRDMVKISISGNIGTPLQVKIIDVSTGKTGVGVSEGNLQKGEQGGLNQTSITKAIGTLGNTKWVLLEGEEGIDFSHLDTETWCPVSWVKKARQHAVEDLNRNYAEVEKNNNFLNEDKTGLNQFKDEHTDLVMKLTKTKTRHVQEEENTSTYISVLVRNEEQIDVLCDLLENSSHIKEVIIDFLEINGIREAVARLKSTSAKIVLATPRIIKAGEEEIWKTLLRLEPDGLLIRSAGLIHRLQDLGGTGAIADLGEKKVKIPDLVGDFSLNTVNTLTASELLNYGGLSRITAAYDLSAKSITELACCMREAGTTTQLEVVVHAHLPIFHTEHCVFARFLTKGNSYVDCGHACTRNTVHLRDQTGKDNLVLADMGCRNTVFSAEAQSGVHSIKDWIEAGIGFLRIELVDEGKDDVKKIVNGYEKVLLGEQRASQVWESLKTVCDSNGRAAGVSHGSFRNVSERRAGEL